MLREFPCCVHDDETTACNASFSSTAAHRAHVSYKRIRFQQADALVLYNTQCDWSVPYIEYRVFQLSHRDGNPNRLADFPSQQRLTDRRGHGYLVFFEIRFFL